MTDDISKVDDRFIAAAFREVIGPDGGRIKNAEICDFIIQRSRELVALESAATTPAETCLHAGEEWRECALCVAEDATPAEVEGAAMKARENLRQVVEASVAKSGSGAVLVSACTVADLFADYATLARQLAEAKAENDRLGGLNSQLVKKSNTQIVELVRLEGCLAQAESKLAEANAELTNLRAANIAYASEVANLYGRAGLAESQLAEANAEVDRTELRALHAVTLAGEYKSQLAEATRRVGEVEGLVGKWRECAEDNAAKGELIQAGKAVAYTDCADELEAALKEPK